MESIFFRVRAAVLILYRDEVLFKRVVYANGILYSIVITIIYIMQKSVCITRQICVANAGLTSKLANPKIKHNYLIMC